MNLSYKELLDNSFHPQSRVWVYQSNRLLTITEAMQTEDMINDFTARWQSHGNHVKAAGHLFFGRFVILIADETHTGVSGCSTDSSIHFMKDLGNELVVDFFDRNILAFVIKDKIELLPYPQVQYALDNAFIDAETLYFNNLVSTKAQLENEWLVPVKESWLAKRLTIPQV